MPFFEVILSLDGLNIPDADEPGTVGVGIATCLRYVRARSADAAIEKAATVELARWADGDLKTIPHSTPTLDDEIQVCRVSLMTFLRRYHWKNYIFSPPDPA